MIVGARQGVIVGPGTGRSEAEARVFQVNHQIVMPQSPATGMPTGKRYHKLLTLRRDFSPASIGIREAISTNEVLTEVRIRFFLRDVRAPLGPARQLYTVQLFNANVCGVRMMLPYTRSEAKGGSEPLNEEVSFSYLTIRWTWNDPQMVAEDDWLIAR